MIAAYGIDHVNGVTSFKPTPPTLAGKMYDDLITERSREKERENFKWNFELVIAETE